ncbi:MAG TPA: ribonuclease III [Myxococcota bacterium]|nr:ribonuclease III [Myxococcota bacterium]
MSHPLEDLEAALGHRFSERALLETALTHPSLAYETGAVSNERLELLGDAVLGLAVAHLLYEAHPEWREGELTRARLQLVSEAALAPQARALSLGVHLRLGRTERRTGGAEKDSLLADAFEAILAALYLDGGLAPVLAFVRTRFADALSAEAPLPSRDPKTRLQEWAQKHHRSLPVYTTLEDSGIDLDEARFRVEARVGDGVRGAGVARTKRVAERRAAEAALHALEERESARLEAEPSAAEAGGDG